MTIAYPPPLSLAATSLPEEDATLHDKAQALAAFLQIPHVPASDFRHQFLLVYSLQGLALHTLNPAGNRYTESLTVDFIHGNAGGVQNILKPFAILVSYVKSMRLKLNRYGDRLVIPEQWNFTLETMRLMPFLLP